VSILIGIDITFNGLILLMIFIISVNNQSININYPSINQIDQKSNQELLETKMFKVQPDIEIGELDNNQVCPICQEKSDEYYIYHFFDNYPKENYYKSGCLEKSHFICLACSKHNMIDLTKCVLCRKKIEESHNV